MKLLGGTRLQGLPDAVCLTQGSLVYYIFLFVFICFHTAHSVLAAGKWQACVAQQMLCIQKMEQTPSTCGLRVSQQQKHITAVYIKKVEMPNDINEVQVILDIKYFKNKNYKP